ncbi:MAG: hypothetical protein II835_05475 [Fibrobacter sp.]|nr:hypothetical protein [Fibrobacter sp.]
MACDTEITKVRIVIRHLVWETRNVVNDPNESQKWLRKFRDTLQYQDLEADPDKYALAILAEARSFNDLQRRRQQMRWVRESFAKEGVKKPTQDQLDEKWLEMYGNECNDQETAQVSTDAGEASHREAEDESATFSGADFTARQSRQVSATADALVNQTRAGAGAQALESPSSLPSPVRNLPRNKEEVRLFAIDNGLDVDDANDWAEMNLRERHGRDKDGKPIRNWKGAIRNYCKAMAAKRETA